MYSKCPVSIGLSFGLIAGFMTALVCQDSSAVLHCPHDSVINIQSAFYGRKSDDICPHLGGSGGAAAACYSKNSTF